MPSSSWDAARQAFSQAAAEALGEIDTPEAKAALAKYEARQNTAVPASDEDVIEAAEADVRYERRTIIA